MHVGFGQVLRRPAGRLLAAVRCYPRPTLGHVVGAAALVVLLQWGVAYATAAVHAAGTPQPAFGDGPYQLFNPLRRIAAGQRGGVDFQFFHGLAVPYLHYPVFAVAGGDYHAGELSRQAVSLALFPLGYLAVFAAATRRFVPTVGLTAAALALTGPLGLDLLALPGNSILGVRAACPFFLLALLLAGAPPRREAVAAGALAGAGFVLGTEQALAAGVMLAAAWAGRWATGRPTGGWAWPVGVAATAAVVAGGFLLAVGGPAGAAAAVRYALAELPADQFWYFGGVSPAGWYQPSVRELFSDPRLVVHLAAGGVLAALALRAGPDGPVLIGVLACGVVAAVGYLAMTNPHYLLPLARFELVAALLLGRRAYQTLAAHPDFGPAATRTGVTAAAGVFAVALLAGPTQVLPASLLSARANVRVLAEACAEYPKPHPQAAARTRAHVGEVVRAIDADRAAAGVTRPPVIWSTYAGLVEAHYGVFHPDADYIIHALGRARRARYLAAFRESRPDYVVTFRRGYFPPFEEWLQQTTWPFYEDVARNYEVLTRTWAGVVWRRRPGPWRGPADDPALDYPAPHPDGFPVERPPGAGAGDPLVVELTYETDAPLAAVPVVGKLPRYHLAFVDAEVGGVVTLPPSSLYGGTVTALVRPAAGKTAWGWVTAQSLTGGRVRVRHVRVRALPPEVADAVARGLLDP